MQRRHSDSRAAPALPVREGYGAGAYRRCVVLEAGGGEVRAELADDFHHFGVHLHHNEHEAVRVEGKDIRVPWTTCPGALRPLRRMEGASLSLSLPDLLRHTPAREQCTHLHDLTCLAIAHAARVVRGGAPNRRYDVYLPDRKQGASRPVLERDGQLQLRWSLEASTIVASEPDIFTGLPLGGIAFQRLVMTALDPELCEAGWLLQRAVFIGMGRRHDFERMHEASEFAPVVGPACYTFAPERVGDAKRVHGSLRDFSEGPEHLLERPSFGVQSEPK